MTILSFWCTFFTTCVLLLGILASAERDRFEDDSPYYDRPSRSRSDTEDRRDQTELSHLLNQNIEAVLLWLKRLRAVTTLASSPKGDVSFYSDDLPDSKKTVLPEYTESLPGTWDRESREIDVQKHYPICHIERRIVTLNTLEHEYRPAYYEEIKCVDMYDTKNEVCSSLGFSCHQWNKTIHLTRRRYSSDCWESKTMIIPAGCECMWPTNRLGNIKQHL